jgi:hypothetical protein
MELFAMLAWFAGMWVCLRPVRQSAMARRRTGHGADREI